jgi:hypothetical protein
MLLTIASGAQGDPAEMVFHGLRMFKNEFGKFIKHGERNGNGNSMSQPGQCRVPPTSRVRFFLVALILFNNSALTNLPSLLHVGEIPRPMRNQASRCGNTFAFATSIFLSNYTMQWQCLWRVPGRRVTGKTTFPH